MRTIALLLAIVLGVAVAMVAAPVAEAHRPYFEEEDIQAEDPWLIDDSSISTALYAALNSRLDVDYYAFEGKAGEVILLALTIPQIEGQEAFAPYLALIGPGLPDLEALTESPLGQSLLERTTLPERMGGLLIEPPPGAAPTFYEPFSRTSYWERQEERVSLPLDGQYLVVVWHPEGEVGRYTFVIGEKERLGGDLAFPIKMRNYWTPVEMPSDGPMPLLSPAPESSPETTPAKRSCGGRFAP